MATTREPSIDAYLLAGPDAVCVCIPYLVGYPPLGSIVVIWLNAGVVVLTMRIDAPQSGDDLESWLADCTRCPICADEVIICAFGGRGESPSLPWHSAVGQLGDRMAESGLAIRDALLCDGDRWWSYLCTDEVCCPPVGRPIDESTRLGVAAHFTYAGMSVLPDRDAVARAMVPVADPDVIAELLRLQVSLPARIDSLEALESWRDEVTSLVLAQVQRETGEADGVSAAVILAALLDVRVRDVVLWELARVADPRIAADRAVALLHRAPEGFRAPIATLAALLCWMVGDGVRAAIAVGFALEEDDEYSMAILLARSLRAGMSPTSFRALMSGITREECRGLAGPSPVSEPEAGERPGE